MIIGCDLKADSGFLLHGSSNVPTLLGALQSGANLSAADLVIGGYRGIACLEVGDSLLEEECVTRSIGRGLRLLDSLGTFEELKPDFVLYDLPGAIGCSGITAHLERSPFQRAFVITSGDLMSFYAANSFFKTISRHDRFSSGALIGNGLSCSFEESFVDDFARQIKAPVASMIPRSLVVRHCELYGKTVIESAPHSNLAEVYRRLSGQIVQGRHDHKLTLPTPLSVPELRAWAKGWGDRLGELEFGILKDGAGI
jgi:nitrogenase iron protein NifH